jgi:hypothetical protein
VKGDRIKCKASRNELSASGMLRRKNHDRVEERFAIALLHSFDLTPENRHKLNVIEYILSLTISNQSNLYRQLFASIDRAWFRAINTAP